jgi:hypothetical protein
VSDSGPHVSAWCDEAVRADALAAAMLALAGPEGGNSPSISFLRPATGVNHPYLPIREAMAVVRAAFSTDAQVYTSCDVMLSSRSRFWFALMCNGERWDRRFTCGPLTGWVSDSVEILPPHLEIAPGVGRHSVEIEATVMAIQNQQDIEELTLAVCAPDTSRRVTAGACTNLWSWQASVEMCATYHAYAHEVARDLALSWLHIHDGDRSERAARLSLDDLAARVEAAPRGARIGIAHNLDGVREHLLRDREFARARDTRPTRFDAVRNGPRAPLPGDVPLTREQILAALATPKETLLQALEAAAMPDDEWHAVERQALDMIEAKKQGAPTCKIKVSTGRHTRFIEQHAPYHVRRLPNGGVMLATHPYRTLWPLWQDALFLLGITP